MTAVGLPCGFLYRVTSIAAFVAALALSTLSTAGAEGGPNELGRYESATDSPGRAALVQHEWAL